MRVATLFALALALVLAIGCGGTATPTTPEIRSAQSTDMTADELRQYFAVEVSANFEPFVCPVYEKLVTFYASKPDTYIFGLVTLMESKGYTVPDGPPPAPPC